MKKLIIISDSHGNRRAIDELDGIFAESDYIIHLGDTSADGGYIRGKYPDKTVVINGNCDPVKLGDDERVKFTLAKLTEEAKKLDCKLALYGHTHRPRGDVLDGVTLLNPGSLSRYGNKSYLYVVVNGNKFTHKIVVSG